MPLFPVYPHILVVVNVVTMDIFFRGNNRGVKKKYDKIKFLRILKVYRKLLNLIFILYTRLNFRQKYLIYRNDINIFIFYFVDTRHWSGIGQRLSRIRY